MHTEQLLTLSKFGISVAMKMSIASLVATVPLFLFLNRTQYLPSISEAAARGLPRALNSVGIGLGGTLFFVSGSVWLACGYTSTDSWVVQVKIIIAFLVHLVTSFCLIGQALVPINMQAELCIHRTLAAIFFLASFILCYLLGNIEKNIYAVSGTILFIRAAALFVGVATLSMGGNLMTAWGNLMSHNPKLLENRMITGFSCMQYIIVLSLLLYIYTFSMN